MFLLIITSLTKTSNILKVTVNKEFFDPWDKRNAAHVLKNIVAYSISGSLQYITGLL